MEKEQLYLNNEKLVYSFMSQVKTHPNDFEDVMQCVKIGLWKAIVKHDPKKKASLTTLAWHCMTNEFKMFYRYRSAAKRKGKTISIYMPTTEDEDLTLLDLCLSDENVEISVLLNESLKKLDEKEITVIHLLQHMNQNEAAKALGCTPKYISKIRYSIIEKLVG